MVPCGLWAASAITNTFWGLGPIFGNWHNRKEIPSFLVRRRNRRNSLEIYLSQIWMVMQVCGFRQEFMEKWLLFREVFFLQYGSNSNFFLFNLYSLPSTFVFVWWTLLSRVRYMVRAKHGTSIIGTKWVVQKIIFLALLPKFLPTGCLLPCAWRLFYQMGQSQYVFSFLRYGRLCAGFLFLF